MALKKVVDGISYKVFRKPRNSSDFIDKYDIKAGDEVNVALSAISLLNNIYFVDLKTQGGNEMNLGSFTDPGSDHLNFMTYDETFDPLQDALIKSLGPAEELASKGVIVTFFGNKAHQKISFEEAKKMFRPEYRNRKIELKYVSTR